MIKCMHA